MKLLLRRFALAIAGLGVAALALPAAAVERVEHSLKQRVEIRPGGTFAMENLIGSITVRGGKTRGGIEIEARVVAEGETRDDARRLVEAVRLEPVSAGSAGMRVAFPIDRHSAFRLPRSEKDGLVAKWVQPLLRKHSVSVSYAGRSVEVGQARGAASLAVHVALTVPMDVDLELRQVAGTLHAVGLRGRIALEIVEGQILAEQIYGELDTRSGGGSVTVRKFDGEQLRLHTGTGSVEFSDVRAAHADLTTDAGEIRGAALTAEALNVETSSGGVFLADVDSIDLQVLTGSGEIDVGATIRRTRQATISTSSGDITLRVNRGTPFGLLAEATGGAVKHRDLQPDSVEDDEKSRLVLRRGVGGADLRVRTDKGEVLVTTL